MSKGFSILIVILLIAALLSTVIFAVLKNQNKGGSPAEEGAKKSDSSSPTPDQTTDWKTYENVGYRIRFKYPPELKVEDLYDLGPNYLQINLTEASGKAQAIFMIKTVYEESEVYDFVGSKPKDVKNLGGQTWYYYDFPEGFSNSPPFTVYQDKKNGILYSFKFYNSVSDNLRDQIMSTVEIILSL